MIMDEVHLYRRNLSCCWVDYRKAFDSISHGYMLEVVSILRFAEPFQLLLASLTQNWCTQLELGFGVNQTRIPIAIRKGIYQGGLPQSSLVLPVFVSYQSCSEKISTVFRKTTL